MSNIKIETLSQIHIGNGSFLQKGNDFIVDDDYIHVLSFDKLGAIIGTKQATIQQWIKSINNGEVESFVKGQIQGYPYQEFTKRRIKCHTSFNNSQNSLKECMHDGFGRPYIPGSSVKGAIRTAVMATLARKRVVQRLQQEKDSRKWKKIIMGMENEVLHFNAFTKNGKKDTGPSTDIFRFLCTGDAFFDKGVEIATKQINLNITEQESLIDVKKPQIVESIRKGVSSCFRMTVNNGFYNKSGIKDMIDLFDLINVHTYKLICDEIDFWSKNEGAQFIGQDNYLDQLESILDKIDDCQPNECVLRIGQASGWRFITGAWLEEIDKNFFKKEVVPLCRPKNEQKYKRFPFPKSRRIDANSNVFGFLKLTYTDK